MYGYSRDIETERFTELSEFIAGILGTVDRRTAVEWALDCAEHVLDTFERESPDDRGPRTAVESGRLWICGGIRVSEVRDSAFGAHASARCAKSPEAGAAARSAGHAAASVHVTSHTVHAAGYAVGSAYLSGGRALEEREWQYEDLEILRKRVPADSAHGPASFL